MTVELESGPKFSATSISLSKPSTKSSSLWQSQQTPIVAKKEMFLLRDVTFCTVNESEDKVGYI